MLDDWLLSSSLTESTQKPQTSTKSLNKNSVIHFSCMNLLTDTGTKPKSEWIVQNIGLLRDFGRGNEQLTVQASCSRV